MNLIALLVEVLGGTFSDVTTKIVRLATWPMKGESASRLYLHNFKHEAV